MIVLVLGVGPGRSRAGLIGVGPGRSRTGSRWREESCWF